MIACEICNQNLNCCGFVLNLPPDLQAVLSVIYLSENKIFYDAVMNWGMMYRYEFENSFREKYFCQKNRRKESYYIYILGYTERRKKIVEQQLPFSLFSFHLAIMYEWVQRFLLLVSLIRQHWSLPKNMFSAALEDAVIYHIKLNSRSFPIYNEKYVISFHNLVIPAIWNQKRKA